jgi:hypothetical protein
MLVELTEPPRPLKEKSKEKWRERNDKMWNKDKNGNYITPKKPFEIK